MAKELDMHVEGYTNYRSLVDGVLSGKPCVILYTSSRLDGVPWCPDCRAAEPVVAKALTKSEGVKYFVRAMVGDRNTWKSADCAFRTDPRLLLTCIPTLIRWDESGQLARLEDQQCADPGQLAKFLS